MLDPVAVEAVALAREVRGQHEQRLLRDGVDPLDCRRLLKSLEGAYANVYYAERGWEAAGQQPGTAEARRVDEYQGWLLNVLDQLIRDPTGAPPMGPRIRSLAVSLALHAPAAVP